MPDDKILFDEFKRRYSKANSAQRQTRSIPTSSPEFVFYVAVYKGRIIGNIGSRLVVANDLTVWHMSGIGVLHELRGYGVGQGLLKSIIPVLEQRNCPIWLSARKGNAKAINLYKKMGFRVAEDGDKVQLDGQKDSLMMVKR
ncbi:GNAT family N-acetyltransferase [Candidatus Omnitrophota bacterium]